MWLDPDDEYMVGEGLKVPLELLALTRDMCGRLGLKALKWREFGGN